MISVLKGIVVFLVIFFVCWCSVAKGGQGRQMLTEKLVWQIENVDDIGGEYQTEEIEKESLSLREVIVAFIIVILSIISIIYMTMKLKGQRYK